jgi:hypothetical protein
MAQMERDRLHSEWTRIDLLIAQASTPAFQILGSQFQGMNDGPLKRGDILQRSSQPGLGHASTSD